MAQSSQPAENDPSEADGSSQVTPSRTERRFVQRSLQEIVRWSPLGGTSWAFASFLLQQEWMTAALLFPATAVSGVWAAYSKNFVERLSEIYAERARTDADKLVAWLDSLNEALKWQFSGFDEKYLKQQAKPCQDYTTEGFGFKSDKITLLMLEEVFVPLQLSGYFSATTNYFNSKDVAAEGLSIWDLIRRSRKEATFRQIAIQAQGGFGKTTLLRHIALIYGQGKYRRYRAPKLIPFLLYLRDWREEFSQSQLPTLPALITDHYLPNLSESKPLTPPPKWVETLLHQGNALVMFDGFDELAEDQRQRVSHWISKQMREYDQTIFIVTSRPTGFKDYVAQRPKVPLFVQKFNPGQQQRFVERWYLCQERCFREKKQAKQAAEAAERNAQKLLIQLQDPNRPELRQMAENPLLLNMLATYHRFDPGIELPKKRVELYQGICKLQLEDRPKARGIAMLLPLDKSQKVLQTLALAMVQQNHPRIARLPLINFLQKHPIFKQEEIEPEAFLKQIVQVSELLVEREPGEFEFPHLSFQGYFAASYLAQQPHEKALALVRKNWGVAWWRETILLYTAQLPPRLMSHVIMEACKLGKEAAQLAYDCLREYRNPEKLAPLDQEFISLINSLINTVRTLRYAKLEDYLKSGQWKEADRETYRLMVTAVGKIEGQWLTKEELLNFPCDELQTIDLLWVTYSQGKWGFSVQKRIYEECGAKLDGEYPDEKSWEEFSDRVGWRKDGSWLDYRDLTHDLKKSLFGEFPFVVDVLDVVGFVDGIGYFSLVQRLVNCSTSQS